MENKSLLPRQYQLFQVDAFTTELFGGNPACVVLLKEWIDDSLMLKIAAENAVAETAFVVLRSDFNEIRWFTPELEMDLCGHATLAAAHVLAEHVQFTSTIIFESRSGTLKVIKEQAEYVLDFPMRVPVPCDMPEIIRKGIDRQPVEVLKSRDYLLVYENERDVAGIQLDRNIIDQINLGVGGIIVTAPGDEVDFVSRYFTPQASVFEDPVTGSAHCSLIPYWSKKLKKTEMRALQLSARKGELKCVIKAERVLIAGAARTYLVGSIFL